MKRHIILIVATAFFFCFQCPEKRTSTNSTVESHDHTNETYLILGAEQIPELLLKLKGKSVGLIVNATSYVGRTHLADTLMSLGVDVKKILAPEHGFRGNADAGELVKDGLDAKLQILVISLYGKNKKPTPEQVADLDILIFDIQDVGARFYTYISTLHYVMESCAEQKKKLIILDRPNPNGYVDGPVLQAEYKSFLGMHPIPVVHGLTVGELAQMINGEGWLEGKQKCEIDLVKMQNWKHADSYSLPIKPSPNLPNDQAIALYPSLGFFEGVNISVGRGTLMPFQVLGHPDFKNMPFEFTPVSIDGMSKNPPFQDQLCHGIDLRAVKTDRSINLSYLLKMYQAYPDKANFFNKGFNAHAGNATLKNQVIKGLTEEAIKASWQPDLDTYKGMRKKYLLYE